MKKAVFLDRDGTINFDPGYLINPDEFVFLDGAIAGLKEIQEKGYLLFIVTNQSGVARGFFSESDVRKLHTHIENALTHHGISIDAIEYSPYYPTGKGDQYDKLSDCRKPNPGMLIRLAKRFNVDINNSYMVGDKIADIQAGQELGCKTILVLTGEGEKARKEADSNPDYIVDNLEGAAYSIT